MVSESCAYEGCSFSGPGRLHNVYRATQLPFFEIPNGSVCIFHYHSLARSPRQNAPRPEAALDELVQHLRDASDVTLSLPCTRFETLVTLRELRINALNLSNSRLTSLALQSSHIGELNLTDCDLGGQSESNEKHALKLRNCTIEQINAHKARIGHADFHLANKFELAGGHFDSFFLKTDQGCALSSLDVSGPMLVNGGADSCDVDLFEITAKKCDVHYVRNATLRECRVAYMTVKETGNLFAERNKIDGLLSLVEVQTAYIERTTARLHLRGRNGAVELRKCQLEAPVHEPSLTWTGSVERLSIVECQEVLGHVFLPGDDCDRLMLSKSKFHCAVTVGSPDDHSKLRSVVFQNSDFLGDVDFRHADIGDDLRIDNSSFAIVPRFSELPAETHIGDTCEFNFSEPHSAARFRTLRRAFEDKRARAEEGLFFLHEQRARRRSLKRWRGDWWVSWFYDRSSNYGSNYIRPFVLLLASAVLFAPLYGFMRFGDFALFGEVDWNAVTKAISFSMQQVVRPFFVWFSDDVSLLTKTVASLQSLLSIVLVTMVTIALRWRFRRG